MHSTVPVDLANDLVTEEPTYPTAREMEVLRLLDLGFETKEIAGELHVSAHTVLNHIRNVRTKLRASTRLDAVLIAQRRGLLKHLLQK